MVEQDDRIAFRPDSVGGSWLVWRPDGTQLTYSPVTVAGAEVVEWELAHVKDTSGNTVDYDWLPADHAHVARLQQISYSDVVIRFQSESRPDPIQIAVGDSSLRVNDQRLQVIDESAANVRIRAYALGYTTRNLGSRQSLLTSVQQYGSDATVTASGITAGTAYPPTTFGPAEGDATAWAPRTPTTASFGSSYPPGPESPSNWTTVLDDAALPPGKVEWPSDSPTSKAGVPSRWLTADFNGDQRADTMLISPVTGTTWAFQLSVETPQPGGKYRLWSAVTPWSLPGAPDATLAQYRAVVGDFNGDHLADLALLLPAPNRQGKVWFVAVALGQTDGSLSMPAGSLQILWTDSPTSARSGDTDGDGRDDLIVLGKDLTDSSGCHADIRVGLSRDLGQVSGHQFDFAQTRPTCFNFDSRTAEVMDVNRDGRADVASFTEAGPGSTARVDTAISQGGGVFAVTSFDTGQHWQPLVHSPDSGPTFTVPVLQYFGDVDGDGRGDLVVLQPKSTDPDITANTSLVALTMLSRGDGTFSAPISGATAFSIQTVAKVICPAIIPGGPAIVRNECPPSKVDRVLSTPEDLLVGDVNGDGKLDFISFGGTSAGATRHTGIDRTFGDGSGGFGEDLGSARPWPGDCGMTNPGCGGTEPSVMLGDVNGDGVSDVMFAHVHNPDHAVFAAAALDVDLSAPSLQANNLLTADVNGDSRPDLVDITAAPDGISVAVAMQGASGGTYSSTGRVSIAVSPSLHVLRSSWRVADVNGDHLDDLVNVGSQTTLVLLAGLSHTWTAVISPVGAPPYLRILTADVDGDGRADLVIPGADKANKRSLVVMTGQQDGTFTSTATVPDGLPDAALRASAQWLAVAIDGSTRSSLVHVEALTSTVMTVMLRNGQWSTVLDPLDPAIASAAPLNIGWLPAQVNTDGVADLVRVVLPLHGQPVVQSLIGHGDGHYTDVSSSISGALSGGPVAGADASDFTIADVDHDGATDLVRVFNRGSQLTIDTLRSNRDGTWTGVLANPPRADRVPSVQPATSSWQVADSYGTGQIGAARLDTHNGLVTVTGWMSGAVPEHLTSIDNGIGAQTLVTYEAVESEYDESVAPSECRLPAGVGGQAVVSNIEVTDAQSHTDDLAGHAYTCGRWSNQLRSFLGFTSTGVAHLPAANRPGYLTRQETQISDAGVRQITSNDVSSLDGPDQPLQSVTSAYAPMPSAPYRNQLLSTDRANCSGQVCSHVTTRLGYDDYGNIITKEESEIPPSAVTGTESSISLSPVTTKLMRWADRQAAHTAHITKSTFATTASPAPSSATAAARPSTTTTAVISAGLPSVTGGGGQGPLLFIAAAVALAGIAVLVSLTVRLTWSRSRRRSRLASAGAGAIVMLLVLATVGTIPPTSSPGSGFATTVGATPAAAAVTASAAGAVHPRASVQPAALAPAFRGRITTTDYLSDDWHWLHRLPRHTSLYDLLTNALSSATQICYDGDTSTNCDALPGDARGLPTRIQQWNGGTDTLEIATTNGYDQWGNLTGTANADTEPSTTAYDPVLHLHPIMTCNALEQCAHNDAETWDRRADAATVLTDADNAVSKASFDELGRPKTTTSTAGEITTHTYSFNPDGARGSLELVTDAADGTTLWARTYRDGSGRTYRTEKPGGDGSTSVIIDTTYGDSSNRPLTIQHPHFSTDPAVAEHYTYDALGRVVSQQHPDNTTATTAYDVSLDGLATVTTTDETGRSGRRSYGGWGELVQVDTPSVEGATAATTRYRYDIGDHQTQILDAHGNLVNTTYDSFGRPTEQVDPDRGDTRTTYDSVGNVHSSTDAMNRTVTYIYDRLDRLTQSTDESTGETRTWTYDETAGHGPAVGRLTSVRDSSGAGCPAGVSQSLVYDVVGNVLSDTRCITGTTGTFTSGYDSRGRLIALLYPDHEKVGYGYDAAGNLNVVSGFITSARYNAADQPDRVTYTNTLIGSWTYDPLRSWVSGQQVKNIGSQPAFTAAYDHGPSGLIAHVATITNGETNKANLTAQSTATDETYGYDSLNRLTSVAAPLKNSLAQQTPWAATGNPAPSSSTWTYDDIGNLTSNPTNGTYSYATTCTAGIPCPGPHAAIAAGAKTYHYDAAGEMDSVGTQGDINRTLSWTQHGMLASVTDTTPSTTVSNIYDANDRRVQQRVGVTVTDYFAGLAEWTAQNGWTDYVTAAGALIGKHHNTTDQWYTTDRQGSVRAVTNSRGAAINLTNYNPWGAAATGSGDPLGYNGQRSLSSTGLIDLNARTYDPALERMLSPDSIIPDPTNPQSLNRYSYAYNNPITYTDPSGHVPVNCPEMFCTYRPSFTGFDNEPFAGVPPVFSGTVDIFNRSVVDDTVGTQNIVKKGLVTFGLAPLTVDPTLAPTSDVGHIEPTASVDVSGEFDLTFVPGYIPTPYGAATLIWTPEGESFASGTPPQLKWLACGGEPLCQMSRMYDWTNLQHNIEFLINVELQAAQILVPEFKAVGAAAEGATLLGLSEAAGEQALAAEPVIGGSKPFVMGIKDHLDDFAQVHGGETWKSLPESHLPGDAWKSGVARKLWDPDQRVLFNLDGVDVWDGLMRAASGKGGATDWELLQMRYGDFPNLEFWQDGARVGNPFG